MKNIFNLKCKNKKSLCVIIKLIILVIICLNVAIIIYMKRLKPQIQEVNKPKEIISYTCDYGYELIGINCTKVVDVREANFSSSCDDGFKLVNDKCVKKEYSNEFDIEWYCPSGYEMGKEKYPDLCYKYTNTPLIILHYYCPNGYEMSGRKCIRTTTTNVNKEYICPYGIGTYYHSLGICIYAPLTKTCEYPLWVYERLPNNGYVKCASKPDVISSCSTGTMNGKQCISEDIIDAMYVRGCNAGDEISSDQTMCIKIDKTVPSFEIKCKLNGYVLDGKTCVKTTYKEAYKEYYCSYDYDLVNNSCIKYDKQKPIPIYKDND